MGAYTYQALNGNGNVVNGVLQGDSDRQIRDQLRSQSLRPLKVKVTHHSEKQYTSKSFSLTVGRLKPVELALLTGQLAMLLESGMPVVDALHACAEQQRKRRIQALLLQLRSRVQEGYSLAAAMSEYPGSFNTMYLATIKAGEHAGYLGPVMMRLASYCDNTQNATRKMRMAMIYPAILVAISMLVIIAMLTFVVPKLVDLFQHRDKELPALTQALISTSDFFAAHGAVLLSLLVAVILLLNRWLKKTSAKLALHRQLFRLLFVGDWYRAVDASRFSSTLSILIQSGVPLLDAISIARQVMSNRYIQQQCSDVVSAVEEGSSLKNAMARSNIFPPVFVQMVAHGEAAGELGQQLAKAAENQEKELEHLLSGALSLLEPLLVIAMGVVVTVIVMAVLLPVFQLNTLIY